MRYTYAKALDAIREKVVEKYGRREDRGHKALYDELRIEKGEWSRKWDGKTRFTWDEISNLAEHFHAPPGWPFIPWETANSIERALETLRSLAPGAPPHGEHPPPGAAAPSGQPERPVRGGRK